MLRTFALLYTASCFLGCAVGAPVEPTTDAPVEPTADAAAGDARTIDASLAVDAPNTAPDAANPVPCDTRYGAVPEYVLCEELPDSCSFNALLNGGNCEQMCAAFEGECLESYDNDPGAPCAANAPEGCAAPRDDQICVCSR